MAFAPNNHMVMQCDTQQPTSFRDLLGDLDVSSARFWTPAGVIVDQDQGRGVVGQAQDHVPLLQAGGVRRAVLGDLGQARALVNLGMVHMRRGQSSRAEQCLLEQEFIRDDQRRSVQDSVAASGTGT